MALGSVLGDKFTSKFAFGLAFIGDSKITSAHSECIPRLRLTALYFDPTTLIEIAVYVCILVHIQQTANQR